MSRARRIIEAADDDDEEPDERVRVESLYHPAMHFKMWKGYVGIHKERGELRETGGKLYPTSKDHEVKLKQLYWNEER